MTCHGSSVSGCRRLDLSLACPRDLAAVQSCESCETFTRKHATILLTQLAHPSEKPASYIRRGKNRSQGSPERALSVWIAAYPNRLLPKGDSKFAMQQTTLRRTRECFRRPIRYIVCLGGGPLPVAERLATRLGRECVLVASDECVQTSKSSLPEEY